MVTYNDNQIRDWAQRDLANLGFGTPEGDARARQQILEMMQRDPQNMGVTNITRGLNSLGQNFTPEQIAGFLGVPAPVQRAPEQSPFVTGAGGNTAGMGSSAPTALLPGQGGRPLPQEQRMTIPRDPTVSGARGRFDPNDLLGNSVFAYNQQNPYLDQMGQTVMGQINENLQRQQLPQIRSNLIASGGFGGSRQGVVEANALRDAQAQAANAMTGARFQDYNNQLNRQMQLLGMNQGFYGQQRGQDLQQLGLGASLLSQGTSGLLGQGQGLYGVGQTTQQAPWQVVNNAAGATSPFTGFGNTTTTGGGNNPWGGMLGGALAGAQFGRLFG